MDYSNKFKGLSKAEVEDSRRKNGINILTPPPSEPWFKAFLKKFDDPLIKILLVAAILSVGIACYEYWSLGEGFAAFFEPLGIIAAILLATGLSFYFENDANREFAILNKVNDSESVKVIRDSIVTEIPKHDVVVGDIVVLNTGEEVPADGEIIDSVSLLVDESSLTGEPVTHKSADLTLQNTEETFPANHLLRGTKILEGHGIMRVFAVGDATENGKVFTAAQIDNSVRTPLDEQLTRLGHTISIISYIIGGLVVIGRLGVYFLTVPFDWMGFISYFLHTVMIAVTLLVVSIPEGLPMAVTLSLAFSMRRMLKTNNLVRRMHACETMGAATVICTDKTGTLTQNCMQVYSTDFFGDVPLKIIYDGIALNSTAMLDLSDVANPKPVGNPTEGALLLWLHARGVNYADIKADARIISELPFTTERKYMATVVDACDGKSILYVKGAPEIVMGMCREFPDGVTTDSVSAILREYQESGMRTLGFAYAELRNQDGIIDENSVCCDSLRFIGVVAISDPIRDDVPDAVNEVRDAGIKVKIITGDTAVTAKEIGRRVGLWNPVDDRETNIMTGAEIAVLSDEELENRVDNLKIIARARPMDKKRLVEALQRRGEVVAVTGDGTNDAPALKAAHVGLSMGDGTAVAKEAGDITIVDNSFASIGRAVEWGRSLYRNIQRFILFQMTVNVVACIVVLVGAFSGIQSPLSVTQMLWVNLIMDTFAAMALASLPPSPSVMYEKPRSRTSFIISRPMWQFIIGVGLLMAVSLIYILLYFRHVSLTSLVGFGRSVTGYDAGLTAYELSLFFTIFVFLQFWNMFNARAFASGRSAFHFHGCRGFLMIIFAIFVGQILIVSFGGRFFSVVPLKVEDWIIIIACTSPVVIIGEIVRLFFSKSKNKTKANYVG